MESLQKSKFLTTDINAADVVFVNDYCYMLWGIAQQHAGMHFSHKSGYKADRQIIMHLLKLWDGITQLERFKVDNGSSFVFWLPHTNTFYDHLLWTGDMNLVLNQHVHYNAICSSIPDIK
eukprot:jgi/Botrbrau1/8114/Bobra.0308s0009.1